MTVQIKMVESDTWYGMIESHVPGCSCSYCGNNGYDKGLKHGLNVPPHTFGFNAWWVIRTEDKDGWSVYRRFLPFHWLRTIQLFLLKRRQQRG